ncbi:integrase core domain-containing protein [Palleronia caenipelagi]|uniref:integrase core domain-containing protein n=1 Tax=Palleronia caenipelagi TaxID=2489174 RepID=UPI0024824172|nr:integrase core domain-containing protein [Palleronia caenipelagi]
MIREHEPRNPCMAYENLFQIVTWIPDLREAQILIEQWRKHYDRKRPHSALGYRPPAPETVVPMDRRPVMH